MSTVASVIADIRVEINDTSSTRFAGDTTTLLPLVKQAIRRANRICQRYQLHFAKKSAALQTVAAQNYVTLPVDCDIPIGLWRDDLHIAIPQMNEADWNQIVSASACAAWFLDLENSRILLNATPDSVIDLTFWYFPTVDPSAYTTSSTMPWSGRLDDIIARYVALRVQNIEEQNVTQDQAILTDMEQSILAYYSPLSPMMVARQGWL